MRILGVDSSGNVASVAIVENEILVAEYTVNNKKTHSVTLLPMLDEIVKMASIELEDIDAIAISSGPGSFTGLRIGAATVKGLGLALNKPIVSVPTLEALAYNVWSDSGVICPIMDARRNQVYTGIYKLGSSVEMDLGIYTPRIVENIVGQEAMDINQLIDILNELGEAVVFVGDGINAFAKELSTKLQVSFQFVPAHINRQRASAIAALGSIYFAQGKTENADDHKPEYLRKSQAEREREGI